jgi:hypothetical protein
MDDLLVINFAARTMQLSLYGEVDLTHAQDTFYGGSRSWSVNGAVLGTSEMNINRYTGKLYASHRYARLESGYHDFFVANCRATQRQF